MIKTFILIILFSYSLSRDILLPYIYPNDIIIEHNGYTLSYIEKHEQAEWVAHKLEWKTLQNNLKPKRPGRFKKDPKIRTGSATHKDYTHSMHDRGHLAPFADFRWSPKLAKESCFMSNISPQKSQFNQQIWKYLEMQIRNWAELYDELYITTGPILEENLPFIGKNKVSIPRFFYKVILDYREPHYKGIGFIIPNKESKQSYRYYAVSIDQVEAATGLNFFEKLPDDIESKVEKELNLDAWSW